MAAIDLELYKTIETIVESKIKDIRVDREEFNLLVIEVRKLAQAQREFARSQGELAQAQKESEKRLARVEAAVEELAQAQKRTEKRVEELADAQYKTEETLRALVVSHTDLRQQVGGLSHTVGFRLEDESYKALPKLLKKDLGIIVKGDLKRGYVKDREDNYLEVNIIGKATRDGHEITIIGEGKSQLSKNDVDDFIRRKIKRLEGVYKEILPVLVTYMTSQYDVEEYARKEGVRLYYSYDF